MAKVIGQRWEIYGYEAVKGIVLKKGEKIVVNQTPTTDGFGNTVVQLVSPDGKKTIEAIYNDWKNGVGSPFRTAADQDVIDSEQNAARMLGDNNTLIAAEEYTDQEIIKNKLAVNEWLAPVKTVSQIPKTGLDSTRNYLIKAVADPVKSGVYQAIAGWTNEPVWALYDDTVDFVDEQEMAAAVGAHNTNGASHADIRANIQNNIDSEASTRSEADQNLQTNIEAEAQTRHDADQNLQDQINMLAPEGLENLPDILAGKADIDSPNFTGTPAAPTAPPGTNNGQIATTAYVNAATAGFAGLPVPASTNGYLLTASGTAGKFGTPAAPSSFLTPNQAASSYLSKAKLSLSGTTLTIDLT